MAQMVKNLPAMQETWVQFLGWKDLLEKEMATHSSILAWRIPLDRGTWQAAVHGVVHLALFVMENCFIPTFCKNSVFADTIFFLFFIFFIFYIVVDFVIH